MSELLGGRTGGVGDGDGDEVRTLSHYLSKRQDYLLLTLLLPSLAFSKYQFKATPVTYMQHTQSYRKKKTTRGANNNDNLDTLIAPPSNNNYKTANNNLSTKPSAKQKKSKKIKNTPFLLVDPIHAVHMFLHCSIINRQDKAYQLRGYRSHWPRCHA